VLGFDPAGPIPSFEEFFQRLIRRSGREQGTVRESHPRKADSEFGTNRSSDKGVRDIHVVGHAVLARSGDLGEFRGYVID